jgi:hypothetical protein
LDISLKVGPIIFVSKEWHAVQLSDFAVGGISAANALPAISKLAAKYILATISFMGSLFWLMNYDTLTLINFAYFHSHSSNKAKLKSDYITILTKTS